jgi:molecular chaperone GrpE
MSARSNGKDEDVELSGAAAATEDAATEEASAEEAAAEAGLAPSLDSTASGSTEADASPVDAEVAALRREVAELNQALLRRRADFENYRKRVERDRATAAFDAEAALLRQLLGTVDNLERALAAQDAGAALREGVVLTHRELLSLLESLGVESVDPLGLRFDPAVQQAILHEPAPGFEPGTVAEVYRKGFRYRDRLLRPALVKVASAGEGPGDEGGDVQ